MPTRLRNRLAAGLALLILLAGLGCSSKKSTAPAANSACVQKAQTANAALESALYDLINAPPPTRPSDVDLQPVYQLYQQALACDGTNADANLGIAVTGLLALSADPEVNAAFDEWKTYLQSHTPFQVPATRLAPLGVPLSFTRGRESLHLPFDLVPISTLALARPSLAAADPQLDRIQGILETRVLPRLDQALAGLAVAGSNPAYRFIVTPRMQGDEGASPVEIDRTDILALRSACGLLHAACDVAVSYQLGIATYDSAGIYQALEPGSGWLALRPSGAVHMGSAGASTLGALDDLDRAIGSLLAETDPQDDDVIKIGPDALSRAEVDSVRAYLPTVRQAIQNEYTRMDDWDQNSGTPDVSLTIRPGRLFSNPVQDWKALFPAYMQSVIRRPASVHYNFENSSAGVSVDSPGDGYYSGSASLTVQSGQEYPYFYGDLFLQDAMMQLLQGRLAIAQATPGWAGTFFGYASFSGSLAAGTQTISVPYYTQAAFASTYAFVPVITWTADSFDAWSWPDPTFDGVLPQMTSTSQFESTFGITAAGWTKQVVLDWTALPLLARARGRLR